MVGSAVLGPDAAIEPRHGIVDHSVVVQSAGQSIPAHLSVPDREWSDIRRCSRVSTSFFMVFRHRLLCEANGNTYIVVAGVAFYHLQCIHN